MMLDNHAPKRRWPRFMVTILVLLVPITIVIVGAMLLDSASKRFEADRTAFENKQFSEAVTKVETGQWDHLSLYDIHGIDEKFTRLNPLPGLVVVHLSKTDITETGLRSLAKQPNLKELAIHGGRGSLRPAELQAISELTQLERLAFDGWCILDEPAIGNLKTLPHLEYLEISRFLVSSSGEPACVTDTTLRILADFKQLRSMKLKGNWFSDSAVSKLHDDLPDCQIIVERTPASSP